MKDAVGNLTSVWEPNPVVGQPDLESTYGYDAFDRLTGVTKLRGSTAQTRTFTYVGKYMVSKTEPETGTTGYSYRGDGRLNYLVDAKGQKIEQVYEDDLTFGYAQKRLAQIRKYPAPGTTEDLCQRVEMFYDGAVPTGGDAGVSSFSAGRLSGVRYRGQNCAQTFVEQYSYTNYGAVVKKRVKMIRGAASGVLESVAEYDGEGRLKSVTYPVTNRKVQYGFNSRGLPETLTDVNAGTLIVSSVAYGVAGEVTTFVSGGGTETRGYNVNGQLTSLTMPGRTIAYNYPAAGQNNGKIESMTESGETIVYQYDSLQRLSSATGTGWSQTYGYDVFGNMNAKTGTGSAPSWSGTIDPATNRLTAGVGYDANGNQTNVPLIAGSEMPDALSSMVYDVSNRLIRAENNGATRRGEYDYDPGNKRVYEKRSVNSAVVGEWAYFFGITGQRLGQYTFTVAGSVINFSQQQASVWFGGKLVQKLDGSTPTYPSEDRMLSVGRYLPYGETKPGASGSNPAADNEKFATYTRDAGTGLDYADQRWYASGSGRFLTGDPLPSSANRLDPGSVNRFSYVLNDPLGYVDPTGEYAVKPRDPAFPQAFVDMINRHMLNAVTRLYDLSGYRGLSDSYYEQLMLATTDERRMHLGEAIADLAPGCVSALSGAMLPRRPGTSVLQQLSNGIGALNFEDYSHGEGGISFSKFTGTPNFSGPSTVYGWANGVLTAFRAEFPGEKIFAVNRGLGTVLLPDFFSLTWAEQGRVLVHEALHSITGQNDIQLAQLLDIPGAHTQGITLGQASNLITNWLKDGCPKKP